MKTEDLKQEAIKKAYGEYWEQVSKHVDLDGWCDVSYYSLIKVLDAEFANHENKLGQFDMRPKSLSGIENNNQWVRIEEDGSNLPKEANRLWIVSGGIICDSFYDNSDNVFWNTYNNKAFTKVTHYQPILQPEPPLY